MFDPVAYGRLARAARIIAGHDRVEDAAHAIAELTGVEISARTVYAIERGEQSPSVEQYVALSLAYRPPGGPGYWDGSLSPEAQAFFRERNTHGPH